MPQADDYQHVLLAKAEQDARAAEAMRDDPRFSDEIVGFHCQQAVEKAIKAVLETVRVEYPLTHDLPRLLALLSGHRGDCPVTAGQAGLLNPFAVRLRYDPPPPDDSAAALDRAAAVGVALAAVEWARQAIGLN